MNIRDVRRGIYGAITASTAVTAQLSGTAAVYFGQAPQDADFPLVIFHKDAGNPHYTFAQGSSAYDEEVWTVKAVDRGSTADTADAIAYSLDALLIDGSLSISGRQLMYLRRESDVSYLETTDGVTYFHSGARYRLLHQA